MWLKTMLLVGLVGCSGTPTLEDPGPEPVCEGARALPCAQEMVEDLGLFPLVSEGGVTASIEGNDWVNVVDATAGGFLMATERPWIYVRFTDEGLQKVDLTDLEALESTEWHVAMHRFKIRLNGGVSGPSCVESSSLPMTYEDVELADVEGVTFGAESFYTDTCAFIDEDSGEEGAPVGIPALALQEWWSYPDCVATTGTPFAIRLASGRRLKFEMLAYYGSGQETCNAEMGAGQDSAMLSMRWRFLE